MIALALGLQTVLWLSVGALYLAHRGSSLFHPVSFYLVFHGLVFVLRPWAVHGLGFDSQWRAMQFQPTPGGFVATLALASLGLLVFAATAIPAGNGRAAPAVSATSYTPAQRTAFHLAAAVLLPLALYGAWRDAQLFGTLVQAPGGTGMVQQGGHTFFQNTTGYIVKAHHLLVPLAALFAAVHGFRWWALLPVGAVCVYRAFLGSRWGLVVVLGVLLLLHLAGREGRWLRGVHLALAVPVVLAFVAIGQDRDVLRHLTGVGPLRDHGMPIAREGGWLHRLDRADFANFDFLAYIRWAVPGESRTHTYFTQHLALVTQPIPRMLWPGKPHGSPVQLVDLNRHGWWGTRTKSAVGDGWLSWGLPGVAITLALAGAGWGGLHRWYARRASDPMATAAYCCFLPVCVLYFRDGSLVTVARTGMWMLLPVVLWVAAWRVLAWFGRRSDGP